MNMDRRSLLALAGAMAADAALAQSPPDHGWYKLRSDEGKPFPNLRLPVEVAAEVDRLPGMIRVGSETPDVTLVEFYDYNCPYCRTAAHDMAGLAAKDADLRLGLVNNAILSEASKAAARVEIAVIKHFGRAPAYGLHKALFTLTGRIDGARALEAARTLGLDTDLLAKAAADDPEIRLALQRQMDVAAALAFTVTPSFMIGGAGVIGYPGPKTMARMVASVRKCELIACG